MNKLNISIANNIKNGEYFIDARNWYINKYIFPLVERSYILLISSILLVVALSQIIFINSIYTQNINLIIPIALEDTINFQPIIKQLESLDDKEANPYEIISTYLVSNYVKMRENYNYENLETQFKKIKNNSTKHIYREFSNNMSLNNPNSPILLYKKSSNRIVKIKSATMSNDGVNVIVRFDAIISNKRKKYEEVTSWIATVSFSMSDINYILQNDKSKFYFFVNDYQVEQVQL